MGRTSSRTPRCSSYLEGNMARGLDLCSVMDVANGLVRDFERAQLEI